MEILSKLIKKVSERELNDRDFIKVYYCFYDKDNELITTNFKKEFIYSCEDI
jgi:hypothetical protein